jgi:regulation of enolase protein 1 (concanavalin A-like superfamily)
MGMFSGRNTDRNIDTSLCNFCSSWIISMAETSEELAHMHSSIDGGLLDKKALMVRVQHLQWVKAQTEYALTSM